MPNGRTHRRLGAAGGGAAALYHARDEPVREMIVETIGGICGGVVGGMLPDRLDPPVSPRHRGAYHSVVLLVVLAFVVMLENQRKACREKAQEAQRLGPIGMEPTLASDGWLLLSGFITGVQWGYVSHLTADLVKGKAGLPLVARGF